VNKRLRLRGLLCILWFSLIYSAVAYACDEMFWQDDLEMLRQFIMPTCVYNNKMYGREAADSVGLCVFDGNASYFGAKKAATDRSFAAFYSFDDVGIFAGMISPGKTAQLQFSANLDFQKPKKNEEYIIEVE